MKWYEKIWKKLKTNMAAVALIAAGLTLLLAMILPSEKRYNEELTQKYTELAESYDAVEGEYKNHEEALKIRSEISELETEAKEVKIISTIAISIILTGLTGLLATLLQYVYTSMPFTKSKFAGEDKIYDEEEIKSSMPVLASALLSAAIIVTAVYYVIYGGSG